MHTDFNTHALHGRVFFEPCTKHLLDPLALQSTMQRRAAVICALRTPIGRYGGALASVRPDDLAAHVIRSVVDQSKIDPSLIDEVYIGAANQSGEDNRNVARMSALLAGLPESVPGSTVNRLCASGLEAINISARMIEANHGDVFIAGGVESMSRAPFVLSKSESAYGRNQEIYDTSIGWRFINPRLSELHHPFPMGETAENVARRYGISREDQDQFAYQSQQKWANANQQGYFQSEITPISIPQRKGEPILVESDEHPRPDITPEKLAKLRPVFAKDNQGTVTAGNSSGVNDGAAALLLVEESRAKELGLKPLAFVGASASAGVDPAYMGVGPVPAIRKALDRANKAMDEIDLIELNEAFAAQSLACARELCIDQSKLNVNGGAIAIGHPLGCSGARIATTLIHEMVRTDAKNGLASLCVGVGQGLATLFERA
jgi:3-oxoadipyl-CoA thiolase